MILNYQPNIDESLATARCARSTTTNLLLSLKSPRCWYDKHFGMLTEHESCVILSESEFNAMKRVVIMAGGNAHEKGVRNQSLVLTGLSVLGFVERAPLLVYPSMRFLH
jgi:hypothetical protein